MRSSLALVAILATFTLSNSIAMPTEVSKKVKSTPTVVKPTKPETIRTIPLPELVPTPNNGPEAGTTPHYPSHRTQCNKQ